MTILNTLGGLLHRWYIVIPGLILALAVGVVTWQSVAPVYERSAWVLLLPGRGTIPEGASNPYLFLGGLSPAADVLVRATSSQRVLHDVTSTHPTSDLDVRRDPTTPGPVIQLTVRAETDQEAQDVLLVMLNRTTETLDTLQNEQDTRPQDRITVSTLAQDEVGTVNQRSRLLSSVGAAGAISLLAILLASAIEGLSKRSTRRAKPRLLRRTHDG